MNLHGVLNRGHGRRLLGVGAVMARTAGTSKKIAIAVAVGMMLGGTVVMASSASAHTPGVETTCEGLTVKLESYVQTDPSHPENLVPNHVTVTVNSTVTDADFATSYLVWFPFVAGQSNTYTVVVTAWDDTVTPLKGYTRTFGPLAVEGCVVAPPVTHEVAPPTVTPPTCDAAGIVTLPTSDFYAWVLNTDTGVYTAVPKNGYTLSGTLTFKPPGPLAQLTGAQCIGEVNPPVVNPPVANPPVLKPVAVVIPPKTVTALKAATVTAPKAATVAPAKVAPAVKTLAFTGAETVPLGLSGLIALVLGAVLTVASRRQRPKQARE